MLIIDTATTKVGPLVREWRMRRKRSQLDLALDVGVSARHLSFVETGRSNPSPELLLTLAEHLNVPLRERNVFLLAAGYAPRYEQTPLEDDSMAYVRGALQQLLQGHHPFPGIVIDRCWNVVLANSAATGLTSSLPTELTTPGLNVFRACLHPDGLAAQTLNFEEWARYLVGQLRRLNSLTNDPQASELLEEVGRYPNVEALDRAGDMYEHPPLLVPWNVRVGGTELSLFTTLTTFGTPRNITLDELAVELFYPTDEATAQFLVEQFRD